MYGYSLYTLCLEISSCTTSFKNWYRLNVSHCLKTGSMLVHAESRLPPPPPPSQILQHIISSTLPIPRKTILKLFFKPAFRRILHVSEGWTRKKSIDFSKVLLWKQRVLVYNNHNASLFRNNWIKKTGSRASYGKWLGNGYHIYRPGLSVLEPLICE